MSLTRVIVRALKTKTEFLNRMNIPFVNAIISDVFVAAVARLEGVSTTNFF